MMTLFTPTAEPTIKTTKYGTLQVYRGIIEETKEPGFDITVKDENGEHRTMILSREGCMNLVDSLIEQMDLLIKESDSLTKDETKT